MAKFFRKLITEAQLLYAFFRHDLKYISNHLQHLVDNERWHDALPIARSLSMRYPGPVSFFNFARTLEGTRKYNEAADFYLRSYRLNPGDPRTQYRIFRSLSLAKDIDGFMKFAEEVGRTSPDSLTVLEQTEEFGSVTATDAFRQISRRHTS